MAIGETAEFMWDYSESADIFNVHKKGQKVAGSAELGDFTVDFDVAGHIMGLEIMNVSDFLRESDITPKQLSEIKSVEIIVRQRKSELFYIWIKFILPGNIERRIPIPAPIMAEGAW